MSTREKDRVKQIQDKCQNLLNAMLRDEDNKYCVDCDAKGPRWASWNIGIFLCIRCAGIHRNLGVHISKVKSVNLDSWTPEQVVSLQQMGNSRARAVYEANLPDSFRRPQTDSALESFIRNKYELKKYIAVEWVPPTLPKVDWDRELDEEAEKAKKKRKNTSVANKAVVSVASLPKKENSVVPPPLPKPSSSPKQHHRGAATSAVVSAGNLTGPAQPPKVTSSNASADLLGLDCFENSNSTQNNEDFTSFLSAQVAPSVANAKRTEDEESFFNQSLQQPQQEKKLTKDSILALYAKTPSYHGITGVPPTNQFLVGGQPAAPSQPIFPPQMAGLPPQPVPPTLLQYQQQPLGHHPQPQPFNQHIAPGPSSNPFYNMSAAQLTQDFSAVRLQPNPAGTTIQPSPQPFQPPGNTTGAATANLWQ